MAKIKANIPKIHSIQDVQLRNWANAVTESIKSLEDKFSNFVSKPQIVETSNKSVVVQGPSNADRYEQKINKVDNLDNPSNSTYPTTSLLNRLLDDIRTEIGEASSFDEWDILNETLEDLGAVNGMSLVLTSSGVFDSMTLNEGDVVQVVVDEDEITGNLMYSVIKTMDSKALGEDSTTDDLNEGVDNLYFTDQRVMDAIGNSTTDDLNEGINNLYFTDQRAMDAILESVPSGTGIYILKCINGVLTWELQP